jgi:hypothetical protein
MSSLMVPGSVIDSTYGSYTGLAWSRHSEPLSQTVYLFGEATRRGFSHDLRVGVNNVARTTSIGSPEEWQKWLALAAALAALGILPKAWQKTLGTVSAALWFVSRL